jgi:hypothetical protein
MEGVDSIKTRLENMQLQSVTFELMTKHMLFTQIRLTDELKMITQIL